MIEQLDKLTDDADHAYRLATAEMMKSGLTLLRVVGRMVALPATAFLLMLSMGAVHSFASGVPAIGYGTTVLALVGLDIVAHKVRQFRK
jgi:hypothetical protein